jgi:simple sugar transport system permease protein
MDWGAIFSGAGIIALLNAGIRLAMPTALAAVGETFCERSGVLNLSLEGMLLAGAFGSFMGGYYSGNLWVGVLAGIGGGLVIGIMMAILSVTFKTAQVINGIVLVLFSVGLTAFTYNSVFGVTTSPPRFDSMRPVEIPWLRSIPGVGPVLFEQSILVYLSVVVIVAVSWLLFRTRFGLSVRAAGEKPSAVDAAGVNVDRVRWIALLVAGAMAGLGGAVLIVGQLGFFRDSITAGRGWVAIALVIFGRWTPLRVFGGALLFGMTDALQLRIQAAGGGINSGVPFEFFQALPYLVTLGVVIVATARSRDDAMPTALGTTFEKESKTKAD